MTPSAPSLLLVGLELLRYLLVHSTIALHDDTALEPVILVSRFASTMSLPIGSGLHIEVLSVPAVGHRVPFTHSGQDDIKLSS